ncbi:hypothetical protein NC652_001236 [Populus alba x Populus x berolinensis]|nr:hypothetical protein NC652_001236 [Populus alba x Populus x berolinensis]
MPEQKSDFGDRIGKFYTWQACNGSRGKWEKRPVFTSYLHCNEYVACCVRICSVSCFLLKTLPCLHGAPPETFTETPSNSPEASVAPVHPFTTKVSSISNTDENKGVSAATSHEVPAKSSADGTSPAAGKSGNLSHDAFFFIG